MSSATPDLPDPEQLQKFFEKWWGTAASVVGTLASALLSLKIPSLWAYPIAILVTLIGLGITIFFYRKQVQKQKEKARREAALISEEQRPPGAAFRGLRPFRRGEQLPGAHRRLAATTLLAQVQQPSFELGIVTGDSGAGKSSLLACALIEPLERAGYLVEFISNLSLQLPLDNASNTVQPAHILAVWEGIRAKLVSRRGDSGKTVVLILDQFEELLSRLRSATARDTLGDKLREAISDRWRIVIGLRKEYLAELKDVAARLGRPVSLQDTFILRNFDPSEAQEVIRECALRDGVAIDDDLPELIAGDLTIDGAIRPPDLQIVCEALHGELTVDRYRRERRAAGLRSRFIKDTIDLAGDSVLARSVLRELCDLPNNKKRPEPISTAAIAEKARTGAPGARATLDAVERVLEILSRAYIVLQTKDDGDVRWSLIHDYMVEPIKIATEEQATRSEAAAAELEYFLAEAASGRTNTIPLARLTEIRHHAPPALLTQDPARRLIRRSLLTGYGKPTALISFVTLISVVSVILAAAQWDVWRLYGTPLSHWEKAGKRTGGWLSAAWLDSSSRRLLVLNDVFGNDVSSRITSWDAQTGGRVAAYSGQLSLPYLTKGHIWSYDHKTGELSRWQGTEKEDWSRMTWANHPPQTKLVVIDEVGEPPNDKLVFVATSRDVDTDHSDELWLAVLNLTDGVWTLRKRSDVRPAVDQESSRAWFSEDSAVLRAQLVEAGGKARLTVWPFDYGRAIVDQQFDAVDISLLGFVESGGMHYLSFGVKGRGIETIPIRITTAANAVTNFEILERKVAGFPSELNWRGLDHWAVEQWNRGQQVLTVKKHHLLVDRQETRTVIWPFDPIAGRFDPALISPAPAPKLAQQQNGTPNDRALVWRPEQGKRVMVWRARSSAPFNLLQVEVQSTDQLVFTSDYSRLLLIHEDNSAELWDINERTSSASSLATITDPSLTRVQFSNDERIVIARQEGGVLHGWTRDGKPLGALGSVGSDVIWTTYDSDCERILIWTAEGQRLDWRLGTEFPLYGFRPARNCAMDPRINEKSVNGG